MALTARRQARELALQALFQSEFIAGQNLKVVLDHFRQFMEVDPTSWQYAEELLAGVQSNQSSIDQVIQHNISNWRIERLALVDLNILRLAAFELQFSKSDVPPAAVINEAIEIAKKYGSTDSGKFVNGVLDQIHRSLR